MLCLDLHRIRQVVLVVRLISVYYAKERKKEKNIQRGKYTEK